MSIQIQNNILLKPYNTFGISALAQYFSVASSLDVLKENLQWAKNNNQATLLLGGGSNVLFTRNIEGLVIQNRLKGIAKVKEDEAFIRIKVGAGEVWHSFVLYCIEHGYAGVENLSLIPGCVGASPMQNIGAYGVEIKEVVHDLTAVHRATLEEVRFSNSDCELGYRESIFKHRYKNEFVITDVTYKLCKIPHFNTTYGAIQQELDRQGVQTLTLKAVSDAVIAIRSSKLPDPQIIGNAGSFFKNPSVPKAQFDELKTQFPHIVAYHNTDGTVKLAAGWLIEQSGLKGYRRGDVGVHDKQALVLLNYANASGLEVLEMCRLVQDAVLQKFGLKLAPEVNII